MGIFLELQVRSAWRAPRSNASEHTSLESMHGDTPLRVMDIPFTLRNTRWKIGDMNALFWLKNVPM